MGALALFLLVLVLICLLLAYAAQTGLGHWQADEFSYFADHRALGGRAYFERLYVSPRPLSELLVFVYGSVVLALRGAFITQALLLLWGGSLLAIILTAYITSFGRAGWSSRILAAVAIGIGPMLLTMQTGPITEMFYWPIATVAYLPTVAAITCLLLLLGTEPSHSRRCWCGAALGVATLSHEIGAAVAIGFAITATILALIDNRRDRHLPAMRTVWASSWWLSPAIAGIAVMAGLVVFRSSIVDLGSDTKVYTGRLIASAIISVWQSLLEVVRSATFEQSAIGSAASLGQKMIFAIGFALIWMKWGVVKPNRWLGALAGGVVVGIYFSIFAAYYHYGDLCCQRQEAARQWLIELLLILVAVWFLARWPTPIKRLAGLRAWAGPGLLIVSLLPVTLQLPALWNDYHMLPFARSARAKTWLSGYTPGKSMEFYMPPDNSNMLVHGTSLDLGTYDLRTGSFAPYDFVNAVGRFFDKSVIVACQSWQTSKSTLVDGTFIPACPPHDGPPDIIVNTR